MTPPIAILAALASSLCCGISTVQQKIATDEVAEVHSLSLMFLVRLLKNKVYIAGLILGIASYGFTLVALQILPLFLVQSLVAGSIVITAIGERLFIHRKLGRHTYYAITAILIGLVLISIGAIPGHASVSNHTARFIIEILPLAIALLGIAFVYAKGLLSAIILSLLAGLAYGNTSTVGRIIVYPHDLWKIIANPLLYSIIISAILGQYLFSVGLQRASVTRANAIMVSMQTLGPAVCGLLLFDDRIRSGFEPLVLVGGVLIIAGSIATGIVRQRGIITEVISE